MDGEQLRRLKELEDENRRLKQLYMDAALDNHILKDVLSKSSKALRQAHSGPISR